MFILLILCNNCKNCEKLIVINDAILPKDLISIQLKLYKIKEESNICQILDSIVERTIECNKHKIIELGFIFAVNEFKNEQEDTIISIEIINKNRFKYSYCHGLFYYKGYQIGYIGDFIDAFFIDNNQFIEYKTINPKKILYNSEEWAFSWHYSYSNRELECTSVFNCNGFWSKDENINTDM